MIKLNGVEIKPTIFPDKTSQVWKLPDDLIQHKNEVEWEFENGKLVKETTLAEIKERMND